MHSSFVDSGCGGAPGGQVAASYSGASDIATCSCGEIFDNIEHFKAHQAIANELIERIGASYRHTLVGVGATSGVCGQATLYVYKCANCGLSASVYTAGYPDVIKTQ